MEYKYTIGPCGNIIQKTDSSGAITLWKSSAYPAEKSHVVDSDRLFQWDSEKFNACCMEVWSNKGQYFSSRSPEEIQDFLSKYLEKAVTLIAVLQYTNVSSGYPYWSFVYVDNET